MAKRPDNRKKVESKFSLALCEGWTEKWFLDSVGLSNFSTKVAKNRDAENIVKEAVQLVNSPLREYQKVYCVFDKDKNTDPQLDNANREIQENNNLVRVYSLPNFEVVFYLANNKLTQDEDYNFDSYVSKNYLKGEKYEKTEKQIKHLAVQVDFSILCDNSIYVYNQIGIKSNNWKQSVDNQAYSEIFKLKDLKK